VDCTNHCIASLISFTLDLVIDPSGTCKRSLRFGLPWDLSEPLTDADLREMLWKALHELGEELI